MDETHDPTCWQRHEACEPPGDILRTEGGKLIRARISRITIEPTAAGGVLLKLDCGAEVVLSKVQAARFGHALQCASNAAL